MEQVVRLSDAIREDVSLEERLVHVLEAAREAVAVDRLHLWAIAPEADKLLYVQGSGLSAEDRRSLRGRPEVRLADAGALARAVHEKTALLVDGSHPRLPRLRLEFEALQSKSFFVAPLLARGHRVGVLVADNKYCGTELVPERLSLLPIFALHVATAVDNSWLLSRLQTCEQSLEESIEQQTATGEILRVISSSPTDLQPVLDAVAESAARLCDAGDARDFPCSRGSLRVAAQHGSLTVPEEGLPLTRDMASGRAVIDRCIVHVPDLLADSDAGKDLSRRLGVRTLLVAPLLREDKAIGTITLRRSEVRPFSDKQIDCSRPSPTRR